VLTALVLPEVSGEVHHVHVYMSMHVIFTHLQVSLSDSWEWISQTTAM